jgi:hypothetical protein
LTIEKIRNVSIYTIKECESDHFFRRVSFERTIGFLFEPELSFA